MLAIRHAHPSTETGLFTTGIVFDNGLVPISVSTVSKLAACGLSFCYVSIYSHLGRIHDAMTQCPGSFAMTGEVIRRFVQAHVDVRFNTVVYKGNQADPDSIFVYGKSLGVSEVRLLKLVRHGDAAANWDQLIPELDGAEFVRMIDRLKAAHSGSIRLTVSSLPDIMACSPTATAAPVWGVPNREPVPYGPGFPCPRCRAVSFSFFQGSLPDRAAPLLFRQLCAMLFPSAPDRRHSRRQAARSLSKEGPPWAL